MSPSNPLPPLLVDARAACALLGGVSEKTLFNWRAERGLPSVKIGNGRRLYSPAALQKWIEMNQQKTAPAATGAAKEGIY